MVQRSARHFSIHIRFGGGRLPAEIWDRMTEAARAEAIEKGGLPEGWSYF